MISGKNMETIILIYDEVKKTLAFNHEVPSLYMGSKFKKEIENFNSSGRKIGIFSYGELDILFFSLGAFGGKIYVAVMEDMVEELMSLKPIKLVNEELDIIYKLKSQNADLKDKLEKCSAEINKLREKHTTSLDIIGNSKGIKNIFTTIEKVARFEANVLIEGEEGVGKTTFAKLIHSESNRHQGPFIEFACGSMTENLLDLELFGDERGFFTGGEPSEKISLIELADKGTLFLDEIEELPLNLQSKLLKAILEKKIQGGKDKEINVDFRLIAASNRKLRECVEKESFREDLFYRLNVISIAVPPLRERGEDVFKLIMHFMNKYNNKYSLNKIFADSAIECLINYNWPGNISELENFIERIILNTEEEIIEVSNLPRNITRAKNVDIRDFKSLKDAIDQVEKKLITQSYLKHQTTTGVAKELNISQPTAARKVAKYVGRGIDRVEL